jgi:hypothetical protein
MVSCNKIYGKYRGFIGSEFYLFEIGLKKILEYYVQMSEPPIDLSLGKYHSE